MQENATLWVQRQEQLPLDRQSYRYIDVSLARRKDSLDRIRYEADAARYAAEDAARQARYEQRRRVAYIANSAIGMLVLVALYRWGPQAWRWSRRAATGVAAFVGGWARYWAKRLQPPSS